MKISKETYGIGILTVLLIGAISMLASNSMTYSGSPVSLEYTGMVCQKVTRADGLVEDFGCNHNVLTNNGKNMIIYQLFQNASGSNNISSMVLGNGTQPAVGDATHPNKIAECGLTEYATLDWQNATGNGNVTANHQWTSTCDNILVNTTGLETAGNTYFAGNNFTSVTLQTSDQLTVTWYVWVT